MGHAIANAVGEATTTTHFKDGSSTVEGDGWSVDYDSHGKQQSVNTGLYRFSDWKYGRESETQKDPK